MRASVVSVSLASGCLLGAFAFLAAPSVASACGGTFCDAPPTPTTEVMPVDQTGENVMFVVADGHVEAHIQIQYTGDPERFAWIVPVMAEPTVTVGSDLLFTEMLDATVPTFRVTTRTENCGFGAAPSSGGGDGGMGCGMSGPDAPLAGFDDDPGTDDDEADDDLPTVRQRNLAGSFEYVVLEGGSVDGVLQWLDENGFAQDDDAPPILQEYIDDGFLFVAFKLRSDHGVDEIHPIVLRYRGDEPCVPLRLTRIAARDDMGVRAFFLGRDRVMPTNFRHVQLNLLKLDWEDAGSNYEEVVTRAVDEDGADGHAFVTEYAGPSSVVDTSTFSSPSWQSEPFRTATPEDLTTLLASHGLMTCFGGECYPTHPLVPSLLQTFVPPPPGVDPRTFYACTSCFADWPEDSPSSAGTGTDGSGSGGDESGTDGDTDDEAGSSSGGGSTSGSSEASAIPASWDTGGLADAIAERVIEPSEHAAELVRRFGYLTRLYTTLSPSEMTRDPLFAAQERLPDVDNVWSATRFDRCEGPDRVELEDGRVIWFTETDDAPPFDSMPFGRAVEEHFTGAPITLRNHAEVIDAELEAWNAEHEGPAITPDDELSPGAGDDDDEGFCSCTSTSQMRGSGTMTLLLLLGLVSRGRWLSASRVPR